MSAALIVLLALVVLLVPALLLLVSWEEEVTSDVPEPVLGQWLEEHRTSTPGSLVDRCAVRVDRLAVRLGAERLPS